MRSRSKFPYQSGKKGVLDPKHAHITALSQATNCSRAFAKTVLMAIEAGTEGDLLSHSMRCDTIKVISWPEEISRFVLDPKTQGQFQDKRVYQ